MSSEMTSRCDWASGLPHHLRLYFKEPAIGRRLNSRLLSLALQGSMACFRPSS
jgi:hypothetical protein